MNKFDGFQLANQASGVVEAVREKFAKYGDFNVGAADVILLISETEKVDPALFAVTWLNETTFRTYSEANRNEARNPNDDFNLYDTGPAQLNVGTMKANIANQFLNAKGIDVNRAFGTKAPLFNGDPLENLRLGTRLLLRIGRGTITGPSKTILYQAVSQERWATMSEAEKNERRVVAYTGPEARPYRLRSWQKFGSMFTRFFEVYSNG